MLLTGLGYNTCISANTRINIVSKIYINRYYNKVKYVKLQ